MRRAYQTDLSDAEWACIEPHLPVPKSTGRPRLHHTREILDSIFYVLKSGCAWRLLQHDFPAQVVRRPRRPRYVRVKEGEEIDWKRIRRLLPEPGFKVLPRRWVVERTFSWIDQNRRMSKDYERLPETGEAFIYLAMSRLMARRLVRT